jgi:hypothetical protein
MAALLSTAFGLALATSCGDTSGTVGFAELHKSESILIGFNTNGADGVSAPTACRRRRP